MNWECNVCSFRHRCGQADTQYNDSPPEGLLPYFDEYEKDNITNYLEYYTDAGAKLTPTLAPTFPDLASEYGVLHWKCTNCGLKLEHQKVKWDTGRPDLPLCPTCAEQGEMNELTIPDPSHQLDTG